MQPSDGFTMERLTMNKVFPILLSLVLLCPALMAKKEEVKKKADKYISEPYDVPFERPIGFSLNVGALSSMTLEGRFLLGLAKNISLIVSPMYQNTIELPFYHPKNKAFAFFDIKRLNLGAGLRFHFYDYDSWDGWYIEPLGRAGMTWIGSDNYVWSVIPSLMFGYASVYDSGYTASFGLGFEWEFLLAKKENLGYYADYLQSAYYGITKIPLAAELSVGWMW